MKPNWNLLKKEDVKVFQVYPFRYRLGTNMFTLAWIDISLGPGDSKTYCLDSDDSSFSSLDDVREHVWNWFLESRNRFHR